MISICLNYINHLDKTCLSLYKNDYITKKDKYIKKYGLKY